MDRLQLVNWNPALQLALQDSEKLNAEGKWSRVIYNEHGISLKWGRFNSYGEREVEQETIRYHVDKDGKVTSIVHTHY